MSCIDIGVKHIADGWIDEIIYGLISLLHSFDPEAVVLGGVMKQQYIQQRLSVQLYPLLKPSSVSYTHLLQIIQIKSLCIGSEDIVSKCIKG